MKNLILFLLSLLIILPISAYEITVERPPFNVRNSGGLEIEKIVLTDQSTTFFITNYRQLGGWFKIPSDTYIRVNGEKLIVQKASEIILDEKIYVDDSGKKEYTLTFPAINPQTERIDFIKGDCEDCLKVWGIELQSRTLTNRAELPEEIKNFKIEINDKEPLKPLEFKSGEAKIKGQLLGYVPEMKYGIEIYNEDLVTGIYKEEYVLINDEGKFECDFPLITTQGAGFLIRGLFHSVVLLTPDEETYIYIDLQQKSQQESPARIDNCPHEKWVYFAGANSDINNEYLDHNIKDYMRIEIDENDIININSEEYKNYILNKKKNQLDSLNTKNISLKTKQFAEINLHLNSFYYLAVTDFMLRNSTHESYDKPILGFDYYDFMDNEILNNPISLYALQYSSIASIYSSMYSSIYPFKKSNDSPLLKRLIDKKEMTPEEIEYAEYRIKKYDEETSQAEIDRYKERSINYLEKLYNSGILETENLREFKRVQYFISNYSNDIEEMNIALISLTFNLQRKNNLNDEELIKQEFPSPEKKEKYFPDELKKNFWTKYQDEFHIYHNREEQLIKIKGLLEKLLRTNQGILFDLITTQIYCNQFEALIPLDEYALSQLEALENPILYNYILSKNEELVAEIEANKKKQTNIYEIPDTEEDMILYEITKPFQGKVIMIDFWATWCGPCRLAMKEFEPTKKEFKDKDIVFIYLTDETSPLTTWENMIVDIDGEHFRLKNKQSNYLKKKFGVRAIPSYLILDKTGEQVYFQRGFSGSYDIKKALNQALQKE